MTQPFCSKSVSACSVVHRDLPPWRRPYMSGDAIGKKHHRRGQWVTYVALKGALENELLSHVARLDVGSRFKIGFGRGVQAEGSLNVGTCVAVVRVKEGSRNARRKRDWGERKFTGRTIPGAWALSRFPQGRLWGRSSVPLRERLGGKICDSVCFEIRARQKNWVGRRCGGGTVWHPEPAGGSCPHRRHHEAGGLSGRRN